MNLEEERRKRVFLVNKLKKLSKEMDQVVLENLNILKEILTLDPPQKIPDWPRKVVLLRTCSWINQIRLQLEDQAFKIFLEKDPENLIFLKGKGRRDLQIVNWKLVDFIPWETNKQNEEKHSFLGSCKCRPKVDQSLKRRSFDSEELTDLLKTEFVYKQITSPENPCDSSSDYFLKTSLDLTSGTIEFFGKGDQLQKITPVLSLNSHATINRHFKKPLVLKVSISSLKLFIFKSKIRMGLSFLSGLLGLPSSQLEVASFSTQIEKNLFEFVREEEILSTEFKKTLVDELGNFFDFLSSYEDEYGKFLILNLTLLSFPICPCNLNLEKFKPSKYFYLVKWWEKV